MAASMRWMKKDWTMHQAAMISDDMAIDDPPFIGMLFAGEIEWLDSGTLHLIDYDRFWEDSGAIHFKVNDGWKVKVQLETDKNNYFRDNIIEVDDRIEHHTKQATTQSAEILGLEEMGETKSLVNISLGAGDSISFDVDGEGGNGIATFKVRFGETNYTTPSAPPPDDEVYIRILSIEHWESVAHGDQITEMVCEEGFYWDEISQSCMPNGVEDTDGDGIPDDIDEYPYGTTLPNGGGGGNGGNGGGGDEVITTDDTIDYGLFGVIVVGGALSYIIYLALRSGSDAS